MRDGFRVYDTDTHIDPGADVLEKYVDPGFRVRLDDLAAYRVAVKSRTVDGGIRNTYRFEQRLYERTLGEAEASPGSGDGRVWRGKRRPSFGVVDDRSDNRVFDMDEEGSDAHFLVPSVWTSIVGVPDVSLEIGLIRAYHRHMDEFCGPYPDRLKGPIVASTRDVASAVAEIKRWGTSKWAVAVQPLLPNEIPVDHPSLEPIWRAAEDHDLAIVHHSFTWSAPFFPGYTEMWDNVYLARLCSHPWGAMRFMAGFLAGGILDRYPGLRLCVLECGFGWLPFWGRRMDEQYDYVGSTAQLAHKPSTYLSSGRFFCSIERQEGEDMFHAVTGFLGDDVLMYASDYPHSECQFPHSVDNILAWNSLTAETRQKLLWDNAARFFKKA